MGLKEMFVLFLCLALGYILCVMAKKQTSILRTLGYTLGISIITLSLLLAFVASQSAYYWKGKSYMGTKMRTIPMVKHHR